MPEMDLCQPGLTYITCASFTKSKEKIKENLINLINF